MNNMEVIGMNKIILVDPGKCVGCRNCALACSFVKEGVFSLGKARLGPIWIPRIGMNVPMLCQHCTKPLCMDVCPVGAISRNEETGAVVLNPDLCIGCKMCLIVCPLGGPRIEPEAGIIIKCDLCGGDPECVKHCLYGALQFVNADEAAYIKRRAGAEKLTEVLKQFA
jgi:carbon-monoxide dehydrogenase iron sulfur subunit